MSFHFFDDEEASAVSKLKGKTIVDVVVDGNNGLDSLTLVLNDGSRIGFAGQWHNDSAAGLMVYDDNENA